MALETAVLVSFLGSKSQSITDFPLKFWFLGHHRKLLEPNTESLDPVFLNAIIKRRLMLVAI